MKSKPIWNVLIAVISLAPAFFAYTEEDPRRKELGHSEKLRILVDKVMQPQAGWKTEEWMVREAAEAGFNVFSPRAGYDDLEAVKRVTEWCAQNGIYHLPWMRGTLAVPLTDKTADGKRLVWANGAEQPLWSVNSDEFWEWTSRYIVEYAKLSVENAAMMGVFLDYENYAPGGSGNLYSLSYDGVILAKFAANAGIEVPALELNQRKPWLEEQQLHDRFAEFQLQHWRERCRALRLAVDALNPGFQFCIYPAPGTPFMVEAACREWATERAPIILADASTYGRPSRFLPEQESLARNRELLMQRMETAKSANIPFIYTGGIDPVVHGADPEFSGKNAVTCSEATGGYWIFYEGPTYTKQDHRDYWKWFTWANNAIAEGRFNAQRQARETPESFFEDIIKQMPKQTFSGALASHPGPRDYPPANLRGDNVLLVIGQKGVPAELRIRHEPVARYESPVLWELRSPDLSSVASGRIAQKETGVVAFTPDQDGIYILVASAGSCAYSIASANVPVMIYASQKASFIGLAPKLYFSVPKISSPFTIKAESAGQETVRIDVLNAQGQKVATGQTSPSANKIEITVPHTSEENALYAIETGKADTGVVEDYAITLDPKLFPGLSLLPEDFSWAEDKQ